MGSETLPSACYILSDESSIPFYSTCNGYKNKPNLEGGTHKKLEVATSDERTRPLRRITKKLLEDIAWAKAVIALTTWKINKRERSMEVAQHTSKMAKTTNRGTWPRAFPTESEGVAAV